jgi:hypothetical protein
MNVLRTTEIYFRRFIFSAKDSFLTQQINLNASVNYFIQCPINIRNQLNEFYTLLIDLKLPLYVIWDGVYHRTKSEIKSFENNQIFEHKVLYQIPSNELNVFIAMFNKFAKHKNIRLAEAFRLKAYNKNSVLAISYIKQDGMFICVNFYRLTQERATNLYSFHLKHEFENFYNSSHFGRAHRCLHWLDIIEFKKIGVNYYDFCGWYSGFEDKALLNVNAFKEQFTSRKVLEYSGVIYNNWFLKLFQRFKNG